MVGRVYSEWYVVMLHYIFYYFLNHASMIRHGKQVVCYQHHNESYEWIMDHLSTVVPSGCRFLWLVGNAWKVIGSEWYPAPPWISFGTGDYLQWQIVGSIEPNCINWLVVSKIVQPYLGMIILTNVFGIGATNHQPVSQCMDSAGRISWGYYNQDCTVSPTASSHRGTDLVDINIAAINPMLDWAVPSAA